MPENISRRSFLNTVGLTLTAGSFGLASGTSDSRLFAYVGRDPALASLGGGRPLEVIQAPVKGGGLDVFRVNRANGSLQRVSSTGPDFEDFSCDDICTSTDGQFLYAVDVRSAFGGVRGAGGGVAAFAIDRSDGSLRHLITRPSMGSSSTAVRIDRTNSRVIVSNHGALFRVTLVANRGGIPVVESPTDSATVALFPVEPNGSLGSPLDVAVFSETPPPGESIDRARGGAICHGVAFDRTQRWVIATDNGYDHLYVYPFNPASRKLVGKAYPTPLGRAPRHIAVHRQAPYIFTTNEREPSVSSFHFDSTTGVPHLIQTINTLSSDRSPAALGATTGGLPAGSPADIRLHPNRNFLYASTRLAQGRVGMTTFAVDTRSGQLTMVDFLEAAGRGQREFNIEPAGKFLFTCNVLSNDVITYALDPDSGKMTLVTMAGDIPAAGVIDFAVL